MDRSNLRLAAKLLAKAEDTKFEAEAAALAAKAYALLADFLNAIDDGELRGAQRRRERRLLHDRRATRRFFAKRSSASRAEPKPSNQQEPSDPHEASNRQEASYRQGGRQSDRPAGGDIDLRA